MKIAVVDDNQAERQTLLRYIEDWAGDNRFSVTAECFASGEAFEENSKGRKFDVVLMDIIMDGKNGIETARRMRSVSFDTLLVFITSSAEFMADAFPCHAFDYVMKPYTKERIEQVLGEAWRALNKSGAYIEVTADRQKIKLLLSDILYVYSYSNYCIIYTKTGERKVRVSFTALSQQLLQHPSFAVVNRGAIVNFDNTSHISGLDCLMTNGDRVPVSRRKIKETEQAFLDRQFERLLAEGK